jgi:hypothetical protein
VNRIELSDISEYTVITNTEEKTGFRLLGAKLAAQFVGTWY